MEKEEKGEKDINYDNLWPDFIDDIKLRTEIQNLPTDIMRILNKDLSQAYNLLMQSLSDPTLKKLIRYQRIRELYQFVTEIILKKKKPKRRQRKQVIKEVINKKLSSRSAQKNKEQTKRSKTEWSSQQERYLCALYLQRSLLKCSEKLKEKFGQSEKWNTTKKIFTKASQIFEKSIKKAFRVHQLKQLTEKYQMNKQNLINELIKKKSNQLQKLFLRYYKTNDAKKKSKSLNEIQAEIPIALQNADSKSEDEKSQISNTNQKIEDKHVEEPIIKSEVKLSQLVKISEDDLVKIELTEEKKTQN